jgi:hypothetical protein
MSAEFVDALKGYDYFLKMRGKVTIEDINQYLTSEGRRTIRQRTYVHYRKLIANGFRTYIPINKFDVFQALGQIQIAADRRRYEREPSHKSIKISRDRKEWVNGVVIDRSLVGFGITTNGKFPVSKGSQLYIQIEGYNIIPIIAVWREHKEKGNSTSLGVRAFEFIAKYQISDEKLQSVRLTGFFHISREQKGIIDWNNAFRILEKTNELLESVSDLIYSLDDELGTNVHVAAPILESIKFGSPGSADVKIDFGIADILKIVLEKLQHWGDEKKRYHEETRKLELENANLAIETVRNAINLRKDAQGIGITDDVIVELLEPVKIIFNSKKLPDNIFEEGSLEKAILRERIIPVVAELVAGDDADFRISVHKIREQRHNTGTKRLSHSKQ